MGTLDLLSDEQWSSLTHSKKVKRKVRTCNAVWTLGEREQSKIAILTDSKAEMTTMTTHPDKERPSDTKFCKNYLKDYSRIGPSKSLEAFVEHLLSKKKLYF